MNRMCAFFVYAVLALTLGGCGAATVNPNYTSGQPDLMRIGGGMPDAKEAEVLNLGSYCIKVTEKWNADGKTPDDQVIWTKDSIRRVVHCQ